MTALILAVVLVVIIVVTAPLWGEAVMARLWERRPRADAALKAPHKDDPEAGDLLVGKILLAVIVAAGALWLALA